jgi:hypothetical protein
MREYLRFWSGIFRLAWQTAWAVVIERSIRALVRDLIILIVAGYSLLKMRG